MCWRVSWMMLRFDLMPRRGLSILSEKKRFACARHPSLDRLEWPAAKAVKALASTAVGDEKTGMQIVLKALEAPLFHIAANAGLEGAVVVSKVKEAKDGYGFNALTEEYVDMAEAGILDPAKVTRSALQNATSVAASFLTTESVVANIKEPAPAAPAPDMGGMM